MIGPKRAPPAKAKNTVGTNNTVARQYRIRKKIGVNTPKVFDQSRIAGAFCLRKYAQNENNISISKRYIFFIAYQS